MDNQKARSQRLIQYGVGLLCLLTVTLGFSACSDLNLDGGEGVGQINFHISDGSDFSKAALENQDGATGEESATLDGNHHTNPGNAGNRVSGLESVVIDVQQLRIHYSAAHVDTVGADSLVIKEGPGRKWIDIPIEPVRIDLLDLTDTMELLAESELPEGFYSEIRLILGNENEVTVDGEVHGLTVPSGQQSGYKVKLDRSLYSGEVLDVTIEFDAARAVHVTGNNRYMLQPVLRVYTTNNN